MFDWLKTESCKVVAGMGCSLLDLLGWGCVKPVRFSHSKGQSLVDQGVDT